MAGRSHNVDPFESRVARRMNGMRSSAMRDLMAITQRPEVISLAGGLPDTASFDPLLLEALTTAIARQSTAAALQYGPTEGMAEARAAIVRVMAHERMAVDPERVIVTTGGQQALDLFARAFIDPGDVVLAEGPTYPGAVPVFSAAQADVRHVPLDAHGLDPALVARALDDLAREGLRPKYLYTIPTFQNPAGVTTTLERRRALVELAAERDLLVLEDNPYSLLRVEGEALPTLRAIDHELHGPGGSGNIAYLGTFSKLFAPGVRVGWLEAHPAVLARINLLKQAADLCSSSFAQIVAARFISDGDWLGHVDRLVDVYRARRDALVGALAEYFPPGATWTVPEGGMFVWATLPSSIDTTDLLARALTNNVAFVPGSAAYLDGVSGSSSMRLNFSAVPEERIIEGIRRIGEAAHEALELATALGLEVAPSAPGTTTPGGSA